jgi:uncharacterized protein
MSTEPAGCLPVGGELRRIAAAMAAFHARARRSPAIDRAGSPEFVRALWAQSLAELRGHAVVDGAVLDRVESRARAYLDGREALLERRIAAGHIVDGHGDLLAEDIFCLPDRPRILDCLEFGDRLRHGDVLAGIGFLAVDLERLGAPDEAAALLEDYRTESGSDHPASLAHLYVAYRAVVSGAIACLRHRQTGDPAAAEHARVLLGIADRHLARGRVRLVLVGGLPGTGKTTLAGQLSGHYGWPVLHSDQVRGRLAGRPGGPRPAAAGAHDCCPQWTATTYAALLDAADTHLRGGESVILDATWTDPAHRAAARRLARAARAEMVELLCCPPEPVALRRLAARARHGHRDSDADERVFRHLAATAAPWPEAVTLDTSAPAPHAARDAVAAVDAS